ncbi:MAG: hypothetical protein F6J92_29460 [Symploca sp. SIO1A3]|nr:hypothetical protein [Symploca sp. SIO1A3]
MNGNGTQTITMQNNGVNQIADVTTVDILGTPKVQRYEVSDFTFFNTQPNDYAYEITKKSLGGTLSIQCQYVGQLISCYCHTFKIKQGYLIN